MEQINQHIRGNRLLSDIIQKCDVLKKLETTVMQYLDASLAAHCRVANFREGCLVLETDSAAWLMHLRFQGPTLLKKLKAAKCEGIQKIEYQVQLNPTNTTSQTPRQKSVALSSKSQKTILDTANNISNPVLRDALLKLGRKE
ncbi:MAG: DUF721 domain-containing protein [Proteobacteria bacterium]|nr:DUF721 domain-containing protein [Pseudomonadota bacterium]